MRLRIQSNGYQIDQQWLYPISYNWSAIKQQVNHCTQVNQELAQPILRVT